MKNLHFKMKKSIDSFIIEYKASTTIIDVTKAIDQSRRQIALLVDENRRLLGVISDGDVRRSILKGISPSDSVEKIVNRSPLTATEATTLNELLTIFRGYGSIMTSRIPVVDSNGCLIGIYLAEDFISDKYYAANPVVIMAGGLGKRLGEYTKSTPKPMLEIGGIPILEHIIRRFTSCGFFNFLISVNYKSDKIKDYFKDGSKFNANISYLEESEKLGTAGSLRLLPKDMISPFFVINGDILTDLDCFSLLDFHTQHKNLATMCLTNYQVDVPYGVVEHHGAKLKNMLEKPVYCYSINAGIYVLESEVTKHIPPQGYFDMTSLLKKLSSLHSDNVGVFPLREYWCDIGHVEDLERARKDIALVK